MISEEKLHEYWTWVQGTSQWDKSEEDPSMSGMVISGGSWRKAVKELLEENAHLKEELAILRYQIHSTTTEKAGV